jgi:HPt (histidine-containing phosphotransfer) domain-containing protein
VTNNKDKISEINEALESDNIELAHRLVHTLKGNAGQLKKTSLQRVAQEVEDRLKDGENLTTSVLMKMLETQFNTAYAELATLTVNSADCETKNILSTDDALEILNELQPVLQEHTTDCLSFVEKLTEIPGSEQLIKHIEDFDFLNAEIILDTLKKTLEESQNEK